MKRQTALERAHQRARCITQSWLSSWSIPFETDGEYLRVREKTVAFSAGCIALGADVTLRIGRILSRNFDHSMDEIGVLMRAIEHPMPEPPRRPAGERAHSSDYLAVSMRLTQFVRTANLPEETILAHQATIKREADRACRRYSDLADRMCLDARDFYTIALVFATIYLHRNQDLSNEHRNGANLTLDLQQEFCRWAKVTRRDLRNIAVDSRGLLASQVMAAPVPGALVEWMPEGAFYTMPEYHDPEATHGLTQEEVDHLKAGCFQAAAQEYEVRTGLDPKRARKAVRVATEKLGDIPMSRSSARRVLIQTLNEMPHDTMVERLAAVIQNDYLDYDTRMAAEHRFGQHLVKCEACRAANEAWNHVHAGRRKYTTHQERSIA